MIARINRKCWSRVKPNIELGCHQEGKDPIGLCDEHYRLLVGDKEDKAHDA